MPEARCRARERETDLSLPGVVRAEMDHVAFLFFLCLHVHQHKPLSLDHARGQNEEPAVGIHHQGVGFFAEGFVISPDPASYDAYVQENPLAAAMFGLCSKVHVGPHEALS